MSAAPIHYQAFIGGEFTDAASGALFHSALRSLTSPRWGGDFE